MNDKNLYRIHEILGVSPRASKEEIKRAYKQKAKLYHPDRFNNFEEKKQAEQDFIKLKDAYDYLMSIENYYDSVNYWESTQAFSDFYSEHVDDDYDEFIKSKKENKFESLEKRAIKFIEDEIKKQKLDIFYIYKMIKDNKSIFKWDINKYDMNELNDFIVKEALYRRNIKNTDGYKGFVKHFNLYNHMNIHATLKIDDSYPKTKFDEKIQYKVPTICKHCSGVGCEKCNNGVSEELITTSIKLPINSDKKFYEINNAGVLTPLGQGKLILTVIKTKLKNESYNFKIKSKWLANLNPLLDAKDFCIQQFIKLFNWILAHKHLSILYGVIVILLIIIICLAILL